jgi:hypothetical protein
MSHLPTLRPGMPLSERIELREGLENAAIERARREARQLYRSSACREALAMAENGARWTPDQIRNKHSACNAEAMGGGCLDECHDPDTGAE